MPRKPKAWNNTAIRLSFYHSPHSCHVSHRGVQYSVPKNVNVCLDEKELDLPANGWHRLLDRSAICWGEIMRNRSVLGAAVLDVVVVHACCSQTAARRSHQSHIAKNVTAHTWIAFFHPPIRLRYKHPTNWAQVADRYFVDVCWTFYM